MEAWFRLKHPEHTRGSLSSSGVVNAILDFTEFDTRVATAAGPACADRLRAITHAVEDAMASDRAGTLAKFQASYFEDDGDFYYMIADAGAETGMPVLPLLHAVGKVSICMLITLCSSVRISELDV